MSLLDKKKGDRPQGADPSTAEGEPLRFVVQKHAATHLHYDFRLELDGVLKSWAIPKGPSLDPSVKRLAMMVEDHPYEYKDFEGTIPEGNYGAGEVLIWDQGTYGAPNVDSRQESEDLLRKGFHKGDLKFILNGSKLKGEFALVKIRASDDNSWLLIKKHDQFATTREVTLDNRSVVSDAVLEDRTKKGKRPGSSVKTASIPEQATKPAGISEPPPGPETATIPRVDPMPRGISPMLATLVSDPFDDPEWIFEIKLDGYRTIAEIEPGKVNLYSRNNLSFNKQFGSVVNQLEQMQNHAAVLDGEIVVLDQNGRSSFQLLQNHRRSGAGDVTYFVFDLLYLDGKDLRELPLVKRKEMLQAALPALSQVRYCDHIAENGTSFFELAAQNRLEGIVAKRMSSRYATGRRSRDWLKIKVQLQQEAIICGYTDPRGSRKLFGSLVLGAYEKGELVYIGFSGGGFDEASLREIHTMLQPLRRRDSPFKEQVKTDATVHWVQPTLVCEVAFTEWTEEKVMRQPVFLGLREDKEAQSVVRELAAPATKEVLEEGPEPPPPPASPPLEAESSTPSAGEPSPPRSPLELAGKERSVVIAGRKLRLTNLDKVFWPEEGYTKRDVIEYYWEIAPYLVPHLKDRPESLYRTPNGIRGESFFQKEAGEFLPEWVQTRSIFSRSNDKYIKFFLCQDEATLIYMANLGCIEINPWLSRVPELEHPDYFVIDLDPEDIAFDKVVDAALVVHQVLELAGATSFPKTSGATGMHIYIPLGGRYDYDTAVRFAQLVVTIAHQKAPGYTSLVRSPSQRQQRVYLDFLQNRAGQTIAAPYSIRARPGAPVSAPLTWEEVKPGLTPSSFTMKNMPERVARIGEIFSGALGAGIDLEACLERLESSFSIPT